MALSLATTGCLSVPSAADDPSGDPAGGGVDAGATAGACIDAALFAPFADDFADGEMPPWGAYASGTSTTVVEAGGEVTIAVSGVAGDWGYVGSAVFDARDRRIASALLEVPTWPGEIWVGLADESHDRFVGIWAGYDELYPNLDFDTWPPVEPKNPSDFAWWQVRFDGDDVFIEVSSDSTVWETLHQGPSPAWASAATLYVLAGTDSTEVGGGGGAPTPGGYARLDDLNLPTNRCP